MTTTTRTHWMDTAQEGDTHKGSPSGAVVVVKRITRLADGGRRLTLRNLVLGQEVGNAWAVDHHPRHRAEAQAYVSPAGHPPTWPGYIDNKSQ